MRGVSGVLGIVALCLAAIGCSGDEKRPGSSVPYDNDDEDSGAELCIDRDHDGFGRNCDKGKDCNDEDPSITDECRRCLTKVKDCPCAKGTEAIRCTPPTIRVDGGVLVCAEGTRYCRAGYWSDCETIGEYVFQAN
jgi:hypothetical protein